MPSRNGPMPRPGTMSNGSGRRHDRDRRRRARRPPPASVWLTVTCRARPGVRHRRTRFGGDPAVTGLPARLAHEREGPRRGREAVRTSGRPVCPGCGTDRLVRIGPGACGRPPGCRHIAPTRRPRSRAYRIDPAPPSRPGCPTPRRRDGQNPRNGLTETARALPTSSSATSNEPGGVRAPVGSPTAPSRRTRTPSRRSGSHLTSFARRRVLAGRVTLELAEQWAVLDAVEALSLERRLVALEQLRDAIVESVRRPRP